MRSFFITIVAFSFPFLALGQTKVGAEFQVNTYTSSSQLKPRVSHSPDGSFVVVWSSYHQDRSEHGVEGQRYDSAGKPYGDEFQVNTYTTLTQWFPRMSHAPSGSFVVVWETRAQSGAGIGIAGQRFTSMGDPTGNEFQVNSYTSTRQWNADVSHASDGSFIVVWQGVGQEGPIGILGRHFDSAGIPIGGEFKVNTYTTSLQLAPRVSHGSDDSFVVVWFTWLEDDSLTDIKGQRFDPTGGPVSNEFQVNSYTTHAQYSPSISHGNNGSFVVAWETYFPNGSFFDIHGQRFDSMGAPTGEEFQVNDNSLGDQTEPSVSHGTDGTLVVVYRNNSDVLGRLFDSNGNPAGEEFRVNTYLPNFQGSPSVSTGIGGSFVVVWESPEQDGELEAIMGQRFCFGVYLTCIPVFADGFESGDTSFWTRSEP